MKINPRMLLRLYPRSWRSRYGSEMLALVGPGSVGMRVAIDVIRQAAAEWRRVAGVDVWLLPLLISWSAVALGRALAGRMVAPPVVHWFDLIASVGWTALVVGRAGWAVRARRHGRLGATPLPRLSVTAARLSLIAAFAIGLGHSWIWPSTFLWAPLTFIGSPAWMIAMLVGMMRHVWGTSAMWKPATDSSPPQSPLGLS